MAATEPRVYCVGYANNSGKQPGNAIFCAWASLTFIAAGQTASAPAGESDESYRFWQPVIDQALKKLETRGWLDVTAFGQNSYCYAPKPES